MRKRRASCPAFVFVEVLNLGSGILPGLTPSRRCLRTMVSEAEAPRCHPSRRRFGGQPCGALWGVSLPFQGDGDCLAIASLILAHFDFEEPFQATVFDFAWLRE